MELDGSLPSTVGRTDETTQYSVGDREEREYGVGDGVNPTILSETLQLLGFAEAAARRFGCEKNPMNLCACDNPIARA